MKILIAHRGNINGGIEDRENEPDYIMEALSCGYDVEVDVWYMMGLLFTGHNSPLYPIDIQFLLYPKLWIHCKNVEALELLSTKNVNAFMHTDGVIITPNGYLWTAPGFPITKRSIAVMPELVDNWDISSAYGVCTDYPYKYK